MSVFYSLQSKTQAVNSIWFGCPDTWRGGSFLGSNEPSTQVPIDSQKLLWSRDLEIPAYLTLKKRKKQKV